MALQSKGGGSRFLGSGTVLFVITSTRTHGCTKTNPRTQELVVHVRTTSGGHLQDRMQVAARPSTYRQTPARDTLPSCKAQLADTLDITTYVSYASSRFMSMRQLTVLTILIAFQVEDVVETLAKANGTLPDIFDGDYRMYQGEVDVRDQVILGGKGQYANETADATSNWDSYEFPKYTFEDIDGLEVLEGPDEKLYAIIQEDSGNQYGERMLLAPLEHERDGVELPYYYLAMSGGVYNTRMLGGVSIPAGTFTSPSSHEFSGVFDLSGLLLRDEYGDFVVSASDSGAEKRAADRLVGINDKLIMVNVQVHSQHSGYLEAFQLDRGGQIYMLRPKNIE